MTDTSDDRSSLENEQQTVPESSTVEFDLGETAHSADELEPAAFQRESTVERGAQSENESSVRTSPNDGAVTDTNETVAENVPDAATTTTANSDAEVVSAASNDSVATATITVAPAAEAVAYAISASPAQAISISPESPPNILPLLEILAWLRRQIVGPFYNRPPTAAPLEIGENSDGKVIGTMGAIDPDGDPLRYKVTQDPKLGAVTINKDGTYTYTPGVGLAANGGEDSFIVQVRDVGFRLFSTPGVISVPVSVTVGAGDAMGIGGTPFGVAMSPDGSKAFVTDIENNRVSVVDIATKAVVGSIPVGESPYGIAVARDGRAYVVNSDSRTVTVIDTTTATVLGEPIVVGNSPTSVAVNAASTRVYVTNSNDGTLSVIDTSNYEVSFVKVGNGPFGVAVSGDKVYVTNEFDDTVSVIDASSNEVIRTITVGNAPSGIAVSGNRAVVTNSGSSLITGDGTVTLIDTTTLSVIGEPIPVGDSPAGVTVDADGTTAYVTDYGSNTMTIIDLQTGQVVGDPIDVAEGAIGIAIGVDGSLYIAGSDDGSIDPVSLPIAAISTFGTIVASGAPQSATAITQPRAVSQATPGRAAYTKGFTVYNLTLSPLTLERFIGDDRPDGGWPVVGTVIPPGGAQSFQIPAPLLGSTEVEVVYANNAGERWSTEMRASFSFFQPVGSAKTRHWGGDGTSDPKPDGFFWTPTTTIYFTDTPGTVTNMGPESGQKRADLMNTLCTSGQAQCHFQAKGTAVQAYTTPRPPVSAAGSSSILNNATSVQQTTQAKFTTSEATKTSIEGSTKFNIGTKELGAELSSKIGQEWTQSKSWEETTTIVAPPYTKVELLVSVPIWRVTGDLTIQYGKSTLILTDVVFEGPDSSRGIIKDFKSSPCDNCSPPAPATTTPATQGALLAVSASKPARLD